MIGILKAGGVFVTISKVDAKVLIGSALLGMANLAECQDINVACRLQNNEERQGALYDSFKDKEKYEEKFRELHERRKGASAYPNPPKAIGNFQQQGIVGTRHFGNRKEHGFSRF